MAVTLCLCCGKPAYERCYSDAGRREIGITRMCELCFDEACLEADEEWPRGYVELKQRLGEPVIRRP